MDRRQINTASAGTTPSPKDRRQTARRWCSPKLDYVKKLKKLHFGNTYIQNRTRGTNAAITKPKSIIASEIVSDGQWYREVNGNSIVLVARANHRCWAFLWMPFSSDCSEAETDPQGYSAPTPIPKRKLNRHVNCNCWSACTVIHTAWH